MRYTLLILKAIALLYEISNTRIKPVAKKADIGSKRLISLAPDIWVQYNLKVYPVLINILPQSTKQIIPNRYESEILGITAHQDYQVINLWEVDVNLVFEQKISTLLPFVPILQGGNSENNLRLAVTELRKDEQLKDLEPLLSFFASFVLDIPLIQQIMRWDMT